MSKKNPGGTGSDYFDYRYGVGDAKDLMDRYGVAGAKSVKPENRGVGGNEHRTVDQVKQDIAGAMMNDYDTRRTMEAAAMAGNKDARRFAKKGFKPGNIYDAHSTMGNLEKEYGKEYGADLTFAAVNADRDALTNKFTAMSAEDQEKAASNSADNGGITEPSPEIQTAKKRVAAYQASNGMTEPGPYGSFAERSTEFF